MAKDILITPASGQIDFSDTAAASTISLQVRANGDIDFEGSAGNLFTISDSLTGSLMSVSDVSGLPILEVFDTDKVVMGEFGSNTLVVNGDKVGILTDAPTEALDVGGNIVLGTSSLVGSNRTLSSTGSATTVDFHYDTKGSSSRHRFFTNGVEGNNFSNQTLLMKDGAGGVVTETGYVSIYNDSGFLRFRNGGSNDYIYLEANTADLVIGAGGSATNLDITLYPKGTGTIKAPTGTYENNIAEDDDFVTKKWVDDQGFIDSQTDNQTLTWTAATNNLAISGGNNVTISTFTNVITVNGNASNAGRIRLEEDTDNGTNYTELKAAASIATNNVIVLPTSAGTIALTDDIAVDSLTTTGTSGAATLISGVLNIPNYENTTYSATLIAGNGLSGTTYTPSTSTTFALDFDELALGGTLTGTDWLIASNGGVENRQVISSIPLSIFNNDSGWTSNTGTVTGTGTNDYFVLWNGTGAINAAQYVYQDTFGEMAFVNQNTGADPLLFSSSTTQTLSLTGNLAVSGALTLGTDLGATYGGTGIGTYATGDILYASASNTLSKLAAGTNTHILTLVGGVPQWQAPAAAGIGGSITDNQIAVGAATSDDIEGSSTFNWNGASLGLNTSDVETITTGYSSIQSGLGNIMWHDTLAVVTLQNNWYFSTNNLYKSTGVAQRFILNTAGGFSFDTAPSGTVDNTISHTQQFQISNTGVINIGTAPAAADVDSNASILFRDTASGNIETLTLSGTADGTKFLRDDGQWTAAGIGGSIAAASRVAFGNGTANEITDSTSFTYDDVTNKRLEIANAGKTGHLEPGWGYVTNDGTSSSDNIGFSSSNTSASGQAYFIASSTNSRAYMRLEGYGDDAYVTYRKGSSDHTWTHGLDYSANAFKIAYSATSNINPSQGTTHLTIATDGEFTFNNNVGGGGSVNFLRADGQWAAPSSGGYVTRTGSPTANQIATFTSTNTEIQGTNATYDGSAMNLNSGKVVLQTVGSPPYIGFHANSGVTVAGDPLAQYRAGWASSSAVALIELQAGADTTNKDEGRISFQTAEAGGVLTEQLAISETGLLTANSNIGGGGTTNFLRADGSWEFPAGTTYTSDNGITKSGNNFKLGGNLTQASTVLTGGDGEGFEIDITDTGGRNVNFEMTDVATAIQTTAADGSYGRLYMSSTPGLSWYDGTADTCGIAFNSTGIQLNSNGTNQTITLAPVGTGAAVLISLNPQNGDSSDQILMRDTTVGEITKVTLGTNLSVTSGVLNATTSGVGGSGVDNRIAIWNGTGDLDSVSGYQWNGTQMEMDVIKIGNEITVPDTFSTTDPSIGTADNTSYGINISKTSGIGLLFNGTHRATAVAAGMNVTGTLDASTRVTTPHISLDAGDGNRLSFWGTGADYSITMSTQGNGTYGGRLDSTSDYNMYFRMSSGTNRGFAFKNGTSVKAQIDGGGTLYLTGGVATGDNSTVRVPTPGGASVNSNNNPGTGAIKISLPGLKMNTMMSMKVHIYDYAGGSTGEALVMNIQGYCHSTGWANCNATSITSRTDREYTVRFGDDGTNSCIWIGETSSTWHYLKVGVTDFFAGHSNATASYWAKGWSIALYQTSFGTVNVTSASGLHSVSSELATTATRVYTTESNTGSSSYPLVWADQTASGELTTRLYRSDQFTIHRTNNTLTAPTFAGALSGNATTATTLQTARTINGTSFNGSANISVPGYISGTNNTDTTQYPILSLNNATGNQNMYTDANFWWNGSTNQLFIDGGKLSIRSTGDPTLYLSMLDGGTSWYMGVDDSNSDNLIIGTGTTGPGNLHKMTLMSTGDWFLGSGTTSSSSELWLDFTAGNSTLHCEGDIIANSSSITSDRRLKNSIEYFEDKDESSLDIINTLRPATFKKNKKGDQLYGGFIAQEIEEVLPHLISENYSLGEDPDTKYKHLNEPGIIPYLVGAMQEMHKEMKEMKEELNKLKNG